MSIQCHPLWIEAHLDLGYTKGLTPRMSMIFLEFCSAETYIKATVCLATTDVCFAL